MLSNWMSYTDGDSLYLQSGWYNWLHVAIEHLKCGVAEAVNFNLILFSCN